MNRLLCVWRSIGTYIFNSKTVDQTITHNRFSSIMSICINTRHWSFVYNKRIIWTMRWILIKWFLRNSNKMLHLFTEQCSAALFRSGWCQTKRPTNRNKVIFQVEKNEYWINLLEWRLPNRIWQTNYINLSHLKCSIKIFLSKIHFFWLILLNLLAF